MVGKDPSTASRKRRTNLSTSLRDSKTFWSNVEADCSYQNQKKGVLVRK